MKFMPDWLRHYEQQSLSGDLVAGLIVTVMLIPQSLAYAMLAGLPPEVGLYASILPIVVYAWFGSSMTMAVGPVAVVALMTASALSPLAAAGSAEYVSLAISLAAISGVVLVGFGLLKLGFLSHLLSRPVISGFISGSAILIAVGQAKLLLGIQVASSDNVVVNIWRLLQRLPEVNIPTAIIGIASLLFLFFSKRSLAVLLGRWMPMKRADILAKLAPMLAIIVSTAAVALFGLDQNNSVKIVGVVPQGLPNLIFPDFSTSTISLLWVPALLISLVGFVESISVAQSLALKRQQFIKPNKELVGLGAANLASAVSGGFPVTGGFSRSVVNFAAGAQTPLAGVISALLMAVVIAGLTGWFYYLPHAALAATIIVAVVSLIDMQILRDSWRFDKADAAAFLGTALGVLLFGVEAGIVTGVVVSVFTLLWRASKPHMAVVGRVPNTEHYRNIERHSTETQPGLVAVRVDESLSFTNINAVVDVLGQRVVEYTDCRYLLLVCTAVNQIDLTALETLSDFERDLAKHDVNLLLAEVKGPVMDRIRTTEFGQRMAGREFLSVHQAFEYVAANKDK